MNLKHALGYTAASTAVFTLSLLSCTAALANPQGPQVAHGQVELSRPDPSTLNVTNSPNAIVNWESFSIGADEATRFIQEGAHSAILNRVTGQDPSAILGQLMSNGRVFLINANGMIFGPDSVIDTAGFVASTLNITDENFLAGNLRFEGGPHAGTIENQGLIQARDDGGIYLIAPSIENSGIIRTEGGNLLLTAGQKLTISSLDVDHIQFEIQAPENEVVNLGQLLTSGGAMGMFAGTIRNHGVVEADSVSMDEQGNIQLVAQADIDIEPESRITASGPQGGNVHVESETGTTLVSGTIEAKGSEEMGGEVHVLGERVGLIEEASIDVSGERGGGSALVGGDYKGQGEVKNAEMTYVGPGVSIKADAVSESDGGRAVVWADDTTRYYGNISARGGADSGDGGFVEVSGKKNLDFNGSVDTNASNGEAGTLLLDPTNITISNTESTDGVDADLPDIFEADLSGAAITVNAASLAAQEGNIVLQAEEDIAVLAALDLVNQTSGESVVFQAGTTITVSENITTQGADVHFEADSPHILGGADGTGTLSIDAEVSTNGGDITHISPGFSVTATSLIDAGSGNINNATSQDGGTFPITNPNNPLDFAMRTDSTAIFGQATTAGDDGLGANALTLVAGDLQFSTEKQFNVSALALIAQNDVVINQPLSNSGGLVIQPFQPDTPIAIGSTGSPFNLTSADLANLSGESIAIGRDNGSGTIIVGPESVSFNDPVTLQSPDVGGRIVADGPIDTNGNSIIIAAGNEVDINSDITTAGGAININSGGIVDSISVLRGGDIRITSNDAINLNGLTTENSISVLGNSITIDTLGALSVAGSLNTRSDGPVDAGDITIGNTLSPNSITVDRLSARNRGGGGGGNISVTTPGLLNVTGAFLRDDGSNVDDPSDHAPNEIASIASEADANGGSISVTASGGITTAAGIFTDSFTSGNGGSLTLTSNSGAISIGVVDTSSVDGTAGTIAFTSAGDINSGDISSTSVNGQGGGIDLGSSGTISTGIITLGSSSGLGGGSLIANSSETINFTAGLAPNGADIIVGNVTRPSNVLLPLITASGDVSVAVSNSYTLASDVSTTDGDVSIDSLGNLTVSSPIQTNGGDINLIGENIIVNRVMLNTGEGASLNLIANTGTLNFDNSIQITDELNLGAPVVGTTSLTLLPATNGQAIDIGSSTDTLMSPTNIDMLAGYSGALFIGGNISPPVAGNITVSSDFGITGDLTLVSLGDISVNTNGSLSSEGTLTLAALGQMDRTETETGIETGNITDPGLADKFFFDAPTVIFFSNNESGSLENPLTVKSSGNTVRVGAGTGEAFFDGAPRTLVASDSTIQSIFDAFEGIGLTLDADILTTRAFDLSGITGEPLTDDQVDTEVEPPDIDPPLVEEPPAHAAQNQWKHSFDQAAVFEQWVETGPQIPVEFNTSNFFITSFIKRGWVLLIDYQLVRPGNVTLKIKNAAVPLELDGSTTDRQLAIVSADFFLDQALTDEAVAGMLADINVKASDSRNKDQRIAMKLNRIAAGPEIHAPSGPKRNQPERDTIRFDRSVSRSGETPVGDKDKLSSNREVKDTSAKLSRSRSANESTADVSECLGVLDMGSSQEPRISCYKVDTDCKPSPYLDDLTFGPPDPFILAKESQTPYSFMPIKNFNKARVNILRIEFCSREEVTEHFVPNGLTMHKRFDGFWDGKDDDSEPSIGKHEYNVKAHDRTGWDNKWSPYLEVKR